MPRKIQTELRFREANEVMKHDHLILQFQEYKTKILRNEEIIAAAIAKIRDQIEDEVLGHLLISTIESLENTLVEDCNNGLIIKKYDALANMLNRVVVDAKASKNEKEIAIAAYLHAFKTPSSLVQRNSELALGILSLILIIGISIAGSFLVPLIPIGIAFAWMGLGGASLVLSSISSGLIQLSIGILSMVTLNKIKEMCLEPLQKSMQQMSNEFKQVQLIHDKLSPCFFTHDGSQAEQQIPEKNEIEEAQFC